jgi:hypothetical protein
MLSDVGMIIVHDIYLGRLLTYNSAKRTLRPVYHHHSRLLTRDTEAIVRRRPWPFEEPFQKNPTLRVT